MIPIGPEIPRDAAGLRAALAGVLAPLGLGSDAVATAGDFPALSRLDACLDGAKFARHPRPEAPAVDEGGFFAREVDVRARPASLEGFEFQATLHAEDAVFGFFRDPSGGVMLRLVRATTGMFEVTVPRSELERALHTLASRAAEKQGAEIKSVALELTPHGPRKLAVRAVVTAKAMLFSTGITLTGVIEITDTLHIRLRGLACHGDGMIGNLAAGFLRPRFADIEAREIPMGRALGGIALRSVEISGGPELKIRASFGGE